MANETNDGTDAAALAELERQTRPDAGNPVTPPVQATGAAASGKPVNRWDGIFGDPRFKLASVNATVYGDDGARKTKKLCTVLIDLHANGKPLGAYLQGKIDAVQSSPTKKPVMEFRWMAQMGNGQAIKCDTAGAERDMDEWHKRILRAFVEYRKTHTAPTTAAEEFDAGIESLS